MSLQSVNDPNNPLYPSTGSPAGTGGIFPLGEPSSVLTFADLQIATAYKAGMAYYGPDGNGAPQVPVDTNDLALTNTLVNGAIRMFIHDAPQPNGWRWTNPIAQVDLWPQISYDTANPPRYFVTFQDDPTVQGITLTGCSLLTLTSPGVPSPLVSTVTQGVTGTPAFYNSMEYRQIWMNGNPLPNTAGFFVPIANGTASPVACTINRSGGTATVTLTSSTTQGWVIGNTVTISSAQQAAYNGNVLITAIPSATTFQYAVSGTPVTPATGTITATFLGQVGTPFTVLYYVGPTQIVIDGNLTGTPGFPVSGNVPFSFASSGDYTLPANFAGSYTGDITYIANTNRGMILNWIDEASIRSRRQNYNIESGTPYETAVRLMPTPSYNILTNTSGFMLPRRRWELMTWRITSEFLSVIFPYTLSFNSLVNPTDVSPAPFSHDETILAACKALVEKDIEDTVGGPDWQYYQHCLQNSYRVDAMSVPKKLGYFGNNQQGWTWAAAIRNFRAQDYQRPTVPVFPLS